MKKKMNAFTLAEVLVTIGILGVIAALTLPSLSVNIQQAQIGPALASAMNRLESANKMALAMNNARSLKSLGNYPNSLDQYLQLESVTLSKGYKKFNKTTDYTKFGTGYNTKDGMTYIVNEVNKPIESIEDLLLKDPSAKPTVKTYYTVLVDINGNEKAPNALGHDAFVLYVDSKGNTLAAGSKAWNDEYGNSDNPHINLCTSNPPTNDLHCAGAVVDNGFKANYLTKRLDPVNP